MKRLNKTFLTAATLIGLAIGCKDESLSPYIPPNGAANGLGQFVSLSNAALLPSATGFYDQSAIDANVFFDENNQANGITYKLQWLSYDNRVNISSIELYVEYNETYSDPDRNPLIAAHGGPSKGPSYPAGKFWKSITPTAQRTPVDITITPADMYTLFQGNTFDYDDDGTAENIFSAAAAAITKTDRTVSTKRFFSSRKITLPAGDVTLAADQFRIRWRLIGDDGTGYGSWSASVCSETVGINCVGTWRVNKDVFNPKATYARLDKSGYNFGVDRNGDKKIDASDNKAAYVAGDVTTITITYDKSILTPPTVTLSPNQGTVTPPVAVDGSTTKFTVDYTAPAGFTGAVEVKTAGAVSAGSAPSGGLTQVASSTVINVDNTAPLRSVAISGLTNPGISTTRVGRGGSTLITVTFNEAMSALSTEALKLSIPIGTNQGLDTLVNRVMTLASNGLSASYLYLWKDSNNPFDNTLGAVTVNISGGRDLAGNAFGGASGTFVNDAGGVVGDAINSPTGFISAYANPPTATFTADLGTQLRWSISQSSTTPVTLTGSGTGGTWFWVAVTAGSTAPTQATRTVTGLANPVYNGFGTITNSKASGSTTSSGENFTPFTANGTFDIYMYFVSSTGNVSPNSLVLSNVVMN